MARPLRVEYPGAVYHVTARGNDRRGIFEDDASRRHWVELLLYLAQRLSHCNLRELGTAFGVTPAAVSQRLQAFRDTVDRDVRLSRQVRQHETALSIYLKP